MSSRAISIPLIVFCLAGCMTPSYLIVSESKFLTFERPFTDASAEIVKIDAEKRCGYRKLEARMTDNICSLTKCTTHYQCYSRADAENLSR